jgi:RNA polymerase primary sigma factor
MPVYMIERERKVRHVERTLTAELGRAPSDDEIALAARLPLRQVQEVREAARHVTSLDLPVGEGEDASIGDLIVSDQRQPPEEVELLLRRESLRAALSKLPASEREVVELRFGIDHEPNTVEQVMKRLHLSRDRVRRIESKALARLRGTPELQALRGA